MSFQDADPNLPQQAYNTLEFWGKLVGLLGGIWVLVEKMLKPFIKWRREAFAKSIRDVLKEELTCIDGVKESEEQIKKMLAEVLRRQDDIYSDLDLFMEIAQDNRARHDETNDLLTALGYASKDRRAQEERRSSNVVVDSIMAELNDRRKERRRRVDDSFLRGTAPGKPEPQG